MSISFKNVKGKIKYSTLKKNFTIKEFSNMTGISYSTITNWSKNDFIPDYASLLVKSILLIGKERFKTLKNDKINDLFF